VKQTHNPTSFAPPPDNEGDEKKLADYELDVEKFKDPRYLRNLERIDHEQLTEAEKEDLIENINKFVTTSQHFENVYDQLESLRILARYCKDLPDSPYEEIVDASKKIIDKEMQSIEDNAAKMEDDYVDVIDYRLRALYHLFQYERSGLNDIENRINEIEEEFGKNIDPSTAINAAIENLSGKNIDDDSTSQDLDFLGEILDLPKVDGKYTIENGDRKWYISGFCNEYGQVALFAADDPHTSMVINMKTLMEALEKNNIESLFTQAEKNSAQELSQQERMKSYELPEESGAHIRVFPRKYDSTVATNLQSSMLFADVMRKRYPNLAMSPILFTDNPAEDIKKEIRKQYDLGKRFFILDIYNHGSKKGLEFEKELNASDMLSIIGDKDQFPDAKYQINTIACFGGGLRDGLLKGLDNDSLKNRVSAFLQVKPHTPNFAGYTVVSNENLSSSDLQAYSTQYYLHLMRHLLNGKSYGEAHVEADRHAKRTIFTDAEAIWNGNLYMKNDHSSNAVETSLA